MIFYLKELGHDPVYYDIEIDSTKQAHVVQRNPPDHSRAQPPYHLMHDQSRGMAADPRAGIQSVKYYWCSKI